jgi:hypothetical protein
MFVGSCDLLPGFVLFIHHINTPSWEASSLSFRVFCLIMIPLQPLSLLIIHGAWLMNISCPRWHNLAKTSQLIHGSFECPCQTIILMVLMGRGVLELPWQENVVITDKYYNQLPLGKIGTMSLVLCCLSLLKASNDASEFKGMQRKLNGFMFSVTNLLFRLPGLALVIIYLDMWSFVVFGVLIFVTTTSFLYVKGNSSSTFFQATTSVAFSIFLPISAYKFPYQKQLWVGELSEEQESAQNQEDKFKRRISSMISIITLPIVYIPNLMILLGIKYLGLKYDQNIVIADVQLEQIVLFYITPMFILSLLSSLVFYPTPKYIITLKYLKKVVKYMTLMGVLTTFITSAVVTEKRHNAILGYMDKRVLMVFTTTSRDELKGCKYVQDYSVCEDIDFQEAHVHSLSDLDKTKVYIDDSIDTKKYKIKAPGTKYYDLRLLNNWRNPPKELKDIQCVKCIESRNLCQGFISKIGPLLRCDHGCKLNKHCSNNQKCLDNVCVDPCKEPVEHMCGTNAECLPINNEAQCTCNKNHNGIPTKECLSYDCVKHLDCDSTMKCQGEKMYGKKCVPVCLHSSCGKKANCTAENHVQTCKCPDWMYPFGNDCLEYACEDATQCPPTLTCNANTRKCFDPCHTENTCGINADCIVKSHKKKCRCKQGYTGNAEEGCRKYECLENTECPQNATCHNEKCVNPCNIINMCGSKDWCNVEEHFPICKCPRDFTGNSYKKGGCKPYLCSNGTTCPDFLACRKGICKGT